MTRRILGLTSSLGLTFVLSFAFTPFGCGGSREWTVVPTHAIPDDPEAPPATFSALMACVAEAKGRLSERVYTVQFDVEVNERGEAGGVKLRDSLPGEPALEACFGDALVGMTLPRSVLERLPKEKAASAASRGVMGQVWEEVLVVGAGINLAPIVLAAAAVTVTVMVGVQVTTGAIDAVRRRNKKEERCQEMYEDCTSRPLPCTRRRDGDYYVCSNCRSNCVRGAPYFSIECTQCGFR